MIIMPVSVLGISAIYLATPIVVFLYIYSVLKYRNQNFLSKKIIYVFLSYCIFVILISLVPILHDTDSYDLSKMTLYGIYIFILCFMLVSCYKKSYPTDFHYKMLRDIYWVSSINSIIAILVLVSDDIRGSVYSFIDTSPLNAVHIDIGMRSSGLFYFGGSIMSMFHCVVAYIGMIYVRYKKIHLGNRFFIFDLGLLIVNIIAIFISGRFGAVVIFLAFVAFLFLPSRISSVDKAFLLKLLSIFLCIGMIVLVYFYNELSRVIEWAFEFILNYTREGKIGSESTDVLKTMYRFPSDLLFGEGIFSQLLLGIDSGYILLIWYGGIATVILLLLVFSLFFIVVKSNTLKNEDVYKAYVFISFLILIGNFKDIYLFASNGMTQLYFILFLLSCCRDRVNQW